MSREMYAFFTSGTVPSPLCEACGERIFLFSPSGEIRGSFNDKEGILPWLEKLQEPSMVTDLFPTEALRRRSLEILSRLENTKIESFSFTWHRDQNVRKYWVRWCFLENSGGALFFRDITGAFWADQSLNVVARIFQVTRGGVAITNREGTILSVNPAFTAITGYTPEEVLGKNPRILKSQHHTPDFYEDMWKQLLLEGFWEGEIWNRKKSGEAYPEHLRIAAIYDEKGYVERYVSVFYDLSELKEVQAQALHHKYHSNLTSLPNRLLFSDRLSVAINRKKRQGEPRGTIAVLYADLDRFKKINDSYGHVLGDKVLARVAQLFKETGLEEETLGYLGGDEYAFFFVDPPVKTGFIPRLNRILELLRSPLALENGTTVQLSGSLGISLFPEDGETPEELLQHAEIAMYRAKKNGGNQYAFFSRDMHQTVQRKATLELALQRGLEMEELFLLYQPQIDLNSREITGIEALVRWQCGERQTVISPGEFIPVAEESGLIISLGEWVLRQACRDMAAWDDAGGPPIPFSVNISAKQLYRSGFQPMLSRILAETGADPKRLILEITENAMLGRKESLEKLFSELRILGLRLSVDDFGTGYSSLAYLRYIPVDELKIDKIFVDPLGKEPLAGELIQSIISLGKSLGLSIVVEGVETEEQERVLRRFGVSMSVQGFLHARPMKIEEVKRRFFPGS
ncbi:MAG TPA: EAL domain-containing protein [Synergistaceae bacterium]|nr:EAL domain-containing protein [Synergistaceae bacterium]